MPRSRNKLLGIWAAHQMGLAKDQEALYAKQLSEIIVYPDCDQLLIRKIYLDMKVHGLEQLENQLKQLMADLLAAALSQVRTE